MSRRPTIADLTALWWCGCGAVNAGGVERCRACGGAKPAKPSAPVRPRQAKVHSKRGVCLSGPNMRPTAPGERFAESCMRRARG